MQTNSEKVSLQYLIEGIKNLKKYHAVGETYCDKLPEWKSSAYGWHTPYFPPEYKKCCLNGTRFLAEASCDLYYFMIKYYERIKGSLPPESFQLNRKWGLILRRSMVGWSPKIQDCVVKIVGICTRNNKSQRPRDAIELMEQKEYKMLEAYYNAMACADV